MLRETPSAENQPANPLQVLERAQGLLEEQRAELARWIADLQAVQHSLGHEGNGDAHALVAENEELRQRLRDLENAETAAPPAAGTAAAGTAAAGTNAKELDQLRAEIELQRELLDQKD